MTDQIVVPRNVKRTIVIAVGVIVAINLGIAGILSTKTETSTQALPRGLTSVNVCDAVVRPQQQIVVQFAAGYSGEITLDGIVALPLDEYEPRALESHQIVWQPGPGKSMQEYPPGAHTLSIVFSATTGADEGKTGSYSCRFKAG